MERVEVEVSYKFTVFDQPKPPAPQNTYKPVALLPNRNPPRFAWLSSLSWDDSCGTVTKCIGCSTLSIAGPIISGISIIFMGCAYSDPIKGKVVSALMPISAAAGGVLLSVISLVSAVNLTKSCSCRPCSAIWAGASIALSTALAITGVVLYFNAHCGNKV